MSSSFKFLSRFVAQVSSAFSSSATLASSSSSSSHLCSRGIFHFISQPVGSRSFALKMANDKPKVVFVLGAPGSGKGTQSNRIVETFGYTHLSAGDLLREERARPDSKFGNLIEECIVNGKIVPVAITCSLLENAMIKTKAESGKNSFLIDGFPRNQDNLDGWNSQMSAKVQLQFVLFFDGPNEVFLERCLKRGAAGSGRSDDNAESLRKRIVTFETETKPIINHYAGQGLVRALDATKSVEEVFSRVKKCFEDAANGS